MISIQIMEGRQGERVYDETVFSLAADSVGAGAFPVFRCAAHGATELAVPEALRTVSRNLNEARKWRC
jgi:hypothetical protein